MMFLLTLLLALGAEPLPQEDALSPERIEAAVEALDRVFGFNKRAERETRLTTLLEHGWVDDERVIRLVGAALRDRDPEVRLVAVENLGAMTSEASLKALVKFFEQRHPKLRHELELWPRIFRAVGRRGDPTAIPTLLENVRGQLAVPTVRARLFGLANIRSVDSIEGVLTVLGELDDRFRSLALEDARTAVLVLTGQLVEGDAEALRAWWEERREEFELPAQAPRLEGPSWEAWRRFWELPEREPPAENGHDEESEDG